MRRNAIFVLVLTVKPALNRFYTASADRCLSRRASCDPSRAVGGVVTAAYPLMVIVPKDHRLKLKLCWKKRHRICTCRTASYGESRNILILVVEKRMGTDASNRSREASRNFAIISFVGYLGIVVVMLWYQCLGTDSK